jgi:NAD(P)-dependent dehydrogenase (short-subunit alcohol dehydrogenase family)
MTTGKKERTMGRLDGKTAIVTGGRLDILVNNAGIYEFAPLEDVTEEHFHKQFDLNVLGLILASKEAGLPRVGDADLGGRAGAARRPRSGCRR